jgi:hypothetical protein
MNKPTKDVAASLQLRKRIRAKAKECYWNAFKAIQNVPDYHDATYVEGFAILSAPVFVFEHAWIEKEGTIIDPTLPEDKYTYVAGLRWQGVVEVSRALMAPKSRGSPDLPFFYRYGWGGCDSPTFHAARLKAERIAHGPDFHEKLRKLFKACEGRNRRHHALNKAAQNETEGGERWRLTDKKRE